MMEQYEKEMRRLFSEKKPEKLPFVKETLAPAEKVSAPEIKKEQINTGKLIVEVTTAKGAVPLSEVTVVIDRTAPNDQKGRKELIKIEETNADGRTKPVLIQTVNKDLSLEPGNNEPFTTVYVSAQTKGFEPAKDRPVDLFTDEISILKIDLVPNPEFLGGEMQSW